MRWPRLRRDGDAVPVVILTVLGLVACAVVALALLARQIGSSWQPALVIAALAHQLFWAAPVAVLALALGRRWYALGVALVLLGLAAATQVPLYVGSRGGGGVPITLLQANLRMGRADPQALVRQVRADRVDVLMTEELTRTETAALVRDGMQQLLPYRYDRYDQLGRGIGMWSRYPLQQQQLHTGFQLGVLSAVAQPPGAPAVILVAAHVMPPYPGTPAEFAAEMPRLRRLLQQYRAGGGPVIVGGDFNATPDTKQFRQLLQGGYVDAAQRVGAGYLPTYPADRWFGPVIAIDHVLLRGVGVHAVSSVTLRSSDHRGVLARLRIPARGA